MRQKLRARIVAKYGTSYAFAEHIGITPVTVSNVLRGKTTPTRNKMPLWLDALDIAPEETGLFFTIKPQITEE